MTFESKLTNAKEATISLQTNLYRWTKGSSWLTFKVCTVKNQFQAICIF